MNGSLRVISGLSLLTLVSIVSPAKAMKPTCSACVDQCCNWAFAALIADDRGWPVAAYSRYRWERYGYPPIPCRDKVGDPQALQRCATQAFDRCSSERCSRCRSGRNPLEVITRIERPSIPKAGDIYQWKSDITELKRVGQTSHAPTRRMRAGSRSVRSAGTRPAPGSVEVRMDDGHGPLADRDAGALAPR